MRAPRRRRRKTIWRRVLGWRYHRYFDSVLLLMLWGWRELLTSLYLPAPAPLLLVSAVVDSSTLLRGGTLIPLPSRACCLPNRADCRRACSNSCRACSLPTRCRRACWHSTWHRPPAPERWFAAAAFFLPSNFPFPSGRIRGLPILPILSCCYCRSLLPLVVRPWMGLVRQLALLPGLVRRPFRLVCCCCWRVVGGGGVMRRTLRLCVKTGGRIGDCSKTETCSSTPGRTDR